MKETKEKKWLTSNIWFPWICFAMKRLIVVVDTLLISKVKLWLGTTLFFFNCFYQLNWLIEFKLVLNAYLASLIMSFYELKWLKINYWKYFGLTCSLHMRYRFWRPMHSLLVRFFNVVSLKLQINFVNDEIDAGYQCIHWFFAKTVAMNMHEIVNCLFSYDFD